MEGAIIVVLIINKHCRYVSIADTQLHNASWLVQWLIKHISKDRSHLDLNPKNHRINSAGRDKYWLHISQTDVTFQFPKRILKTLSFQLLFCPLSMQYIVMPLYFWKFSYTNSPKFYQQFKEVLLSYKTMYWHHVYCSDQFRGISHTRMLWCTADDETEPLGSWWDCYRQLCPASSINAEPVLMEMMVDELCMRRLPSTNQHFVGGVFSCIVPSAYMKRLLLELWAFHQSGRSYES